MNLLGTSSQPCGARAALDRTTLRPLHRADEEHFPTRPTPGGASAHILPAAAVSQRTAFPSGPQSRAGLQPGKNSDREAAGQYVHWRQIVTLHGKRAYVALYHWDTRKSVPERGACERIVVIGPTDGKAGVSQPGREPTHTAEQATGGQRAARQPRDAAFVMIRCGPWASVGSTGRYISLGHQGKPAHREASVRACQQVGGLVSGQVDSDSAIVIPGTFT